MKNPYQLAYERLESIAGQMKKTAEVSNINDFARVATELEIYRGVLSEVFENFLELRGITDVDCNDDGYDYHEVIYDWHDNSFEIKDAGSKIFISDEDWQYLKPFGFELGWIQYECSCLAYFPGFEKMDTRACTTTHTPAWWDEHLLNLK